MSTEDGLESLVAPRFPVWLRNVNPPARNGARASGPECNLGKSFKADDGQNWSILITPLLLQLWALL
jgi:hypothetical protein